MRPSTVRIDEDQPRLGTSPVVLLSPVFAQFLNELQRDALGAILDGFPFRPTSPTQPVAQVSELVFWNGDLVVDDPAVCHDSAFNGSNDVMALR
jgi:hypothetical protein